MPQELDCPVVRVQALCFGVSAEDVVVVSPGSVSLQDASLRRGSFGVGTGR